MEDNSKAPALNIKVAVSGQVQSDTRIVYTYPNAYDPQKATAADTWLRAIFDPRDARNFATKKAYSFWHAPQGNYYGMIVPSPDDTRNGRLMITIFVGPRIIRSGKSLIDAFDKLEKMLILNPSTTDAETVTKILSTLVLVKDQLGMRSSAAGNIGYRGFEDAADLEKMLSNCDQKEYCNYRRVLFVPSMALPPANAMGLTEIRTPIVPFVAPKPVAAPRPAPRPVGPAPKAPQPEPMSGARLTAYIIGGVVGIYLLFAACCGFYAGVVPPFRSDKTADAENTEQPSDSTKQAENPNTATAGAGDASADVNYMKTNNIWDKESITSDQYRTLIDFINNGQVDEIILNTDWFNAGDANALWTQIYDTMKSHSEKKEAIKGALQAASVNGRVMLETLNNRLQEIVNEQSAPSAPSVSETRPTTPRHGTQRQEPSRHDVAKKAPSKKPDVAPKKEKPAAKPAPKPEKKQPSTSSDNGSKRRERQKSKES